MRCVRYDYTFSDSSFGYRPGRSQAQAVERAREIVQSGGRYVVSIDLSKFFDRVNHDRLMSRLAMRIKDKRVLKLIRAFLNSGIELENCEITYPGDKRSAEAALIRAAETNGNVNVRRKAGRSRRSYQISCSTNSIRNSNFVAKRKT